jgi:hypothetical protein
MIDTEIEKLLDTSYKWLKDKTSLKAVKPGNKWYELTTPYLDRHNDYLQFYIKKDGAEYILSDDGYTIKDLELSGCLINTPKRKEVLYHTVSGFGIKLDDANILSVRTTIDNFPVNKLNIIQAMLAVNDMFYLAASKTQSFFLEDISGWFIKSNIRFFEDFKLTGKTGFTYPFDFAIPRSPKEPDRLIKTMPTPNKSSVQNIALCWYDTKETRKADTKLITLINDTDSIVDSSLHDALTNCGIIPFLWSEREKRKELLSA